MLSIFICEDDIRYRKMMSNCISTYLNFEEYDAELVIATFDPEEIIRHLKKHKVNGLYFLDIELEGGYNGVEVARKIRQYDPRGFIVFVSAYARYLSLTFEYKVEALDYIHKLDDDTVSLAVCSCIENAYQKHVSRSDNGYFIFQLPQNRKISCCYDDILFFEIESPGSKRVILHTKKRVYTFWSSLESIAGSLSSGLFFRCHKSYLVNIESLTDKVVDELRQGADIIVMPNGAECHVSTRKAKYLLSFLKTRNKSQG